VRACVRACVRECVYVLVWFLSATATSSHNHIFTYEASYNHTQMRVPLS